MKFNIGDTVIRYRGGRNWGNNVHNSKYEEMHEGDMDVITFISSDGVTLGLKKYGTGHAAMNYKLVPSDWDE